MAQNKSLALGSSEALSNIAELSEFRREVLRRSLEVLKLPDVPAFLDAARHRIAKVTFLAGAGSRWIQSVLDAGKENEIDISRPRCTALVDDIYDTGRRICIGAYNLRAARALGRQYIIWGSHREDISEMARLAGIADAVLVRQSIPPGAKGPLGHGDAMVQLLEQLHPGAEIVISAFGGDPNCGETMLIAAAYLLAIGMDRTMEVNAVLPAALLPQPDYPISLDADGHPRSFGQARLKGAAASGGKAWCNVGVRVYRRAALTQAARYFRKFFDAAHACYCVPGNKEPALALDNIDEFFAGLYSQDGGPADKGLQLLGICHPFEITSAVKRYQDLSGFLESQRQIRKCSLGLL